MPRDTLTRLCVILPAGHAAETAEALSAQLALRVAHGWEEESLPDGSFRCIVHCTVPQACDDTAAALAALFPEARIERDQVEETDWVEAWKEFFTPVEAGRHFLVVAPWMEEEQRSTDRIPIIIEPKTAFGTGHHASTALCLAALSSLDDEGRMDSGARFLDLGTGTGILGIACTKLGLCGDGLDVDPIAVDNALENRDANDILPERFRVSCGGLEAAKPPYGLVVANILAGPLIDMAPQIAELGNGKRPLLVLSGILDRQADDVEAAYAAQGFAPIQRFTREEWVALVLR